MRIKLIILLLTGFFLTNVLANSAPYIEHTGIHDAGTQGGFGTYGAVHTGNGDGKHYVFYRDADADNGKASVYPLYLEDNNASKGFSPRRIGSEIAIALDNNDVPYVIFQEAEIDYRATVMKYDSGSWVIVGDQTFSVGSMNVPSIAFDSFNTPYVAYKDNGASKIFVKKLNGDTWDDLGSTAIVSGNSYNSSMKIDQTTDTIYVAYKNSDDKLSVQKYQDDTWSFLGSDGFTAGTAYFSAFTLDNNGIPYIALQDGSAGQKPSVMRFYDSNSSWEYVGVAGGVVDAVTTSIDILFNQYNELFLASNDYNENDMPGGPFYDIFLCKHDASGWHVEKTSAYGTRTIRFDLTETDNSSIRVLLKSSSFHYRTFDYKIKHSIAENTTAVYTASASDSQSDGITLSLSGTDADLFNIDGAEITFKVAPDYENPADDGADNVYNFNVIATDDGSPVASSARNIVLSVTEVNETPTISAITDTTIDEENNATLSFTLMDEDDNVSTFDVVASSSNQSLLPDANITLGGSGADRTISLYPVANGYGSATITLEISDGEHNATEIFILNVTAINDQPQMSDISDLTIDEDTVSSALSFTISDIETASDELNVTATSTNAALLPIENIVFGGSGDSRTVTLTPTANYSGTTTITIDVDDGNLSVSDTFVLNVTALNDDNITIGVINNVTAYEGVATAPISFDVGDDTGGYTIEILSDNTSLIPNDTYDTTKNILSSYDSDTKWRVYTERVLLHPIEGQTGVANITVKITDSDSVVIAESTFSITVVAQNNAPIIDDISDSWEILGNTNVIDSLTSASFYNTALDNNGTLYVSYRDVNNSDKLSVKKYNGLTWEFVGNPGIGDGSAGSNTIAFDHNNTPYILYQDYLTTTVKKYVNDNWESVGTTVSDYTIREDPTITFDTQNMPIIAFKTRPSAWTFWKVIAFDGNDWIDYLLNTGGEYEELQFAFDAFGSLYTATYHNENFKQVRKYRFDGYHHYWDDVGTDGSGSGSAREMYFDEHNVMHVLDSKYLMMFDGDDWVIKNEDTNFTKDAAYTSNNSLYKLIGGTADDSFVQKYNGMEWDSFEKFTLEPRVLAYTNYMQLNVDSSSTPYVSYSDSNNSYETSVVSRLASFTVDEGETFVTTLGATDPDGDNVTFTLRGNDAALFNINQADATITFKNAPDYETDSNYSYSVTLIATDDGTPSMSSAKHIYIRVQDANEAPTSLDINVTIDEDSNKTFSANDFNFTDVDEGDELVSLYITSLQSSGTLQLNDSNVTLNQAIIATELANLKFIPDANANGTPYSAFKFMVNDGDMNSTLEYDVTINVTPINDILTFEAIASQLQDEDFNDYNITLVGEDVDGDSIEFAASSSDTNIATVSVVDGKLLFTPVANANGTVTIEVNATAGGETVTQTFSFEITSLDDAPILSTIGNPDAQDEDFEDFNVTLESSDAENDARTYAVSTPNSDIVNLIVTGNQLRITSRANAYGDVSVDVNVTQDSNSTLNDTQTFTFNVASINDAPKIDTAFEDISLNEDNGTSYYDINVSDVEDTNLTLYVESNDTALINVDANWSNPITFGNYADALDFNLTTVANANGVATITITLDDGDKNATSSFEVNVTPVDDLPTIDAIAAQLQDEDFDDYNITLAGEDVDGDSIEFSASSSDTNIATVSVVDGKLLFTPVTNANGTVTIEVTATAGGEVATQTFTLEISAIDDKPVFVGLQNPNDVDEDFSDFNVTLSSWDAEDNARSYTASTQNGDKITINLIGNQLIISSIADKFGAISVDLNVTQDSNATLSTMETISFGVSAVNDAPTIDSDFANATYANGTTHNYAVDITDVDGDSLTLSVESNNTNVATLTPNWTNPIILDTYSNGTLDFDLNVISTTDKSVRVSITLDDGESNVTKDFNISVEEDATTNNANPALIMYLLN